MDLYTYKTETWAKKFLRGWLRRAMSSRIEPVKRAAKMIRSHFDGVIAWVTWRLSNGRLEGMNNKIQLLSHRSSHPKGRWSPSLLHSTRCLSRSARNGCWTSHQLTPLSLSRADAGS